MAGQRVEGVCACCWAPTINGVERRRAISAEAQAALRELRERFEPHMIEEGEDG